MTSRGRRNRKTRVGIVVSDKTKKTLVVDVRRVYRHPFYGKVMRGGSRCYVHDERGEASSGDLVRIMECRPLSKLKRWRLVEVVKKHAGGEDKAFAEKEIKELQGEIYEKAPKERET